VLGEGPNLPYRLTARQQSAFDRLKELGDIEQHGHDNDEGDQDQGDHGDHGEAEDAENAKDTERTASDCEDVSEDAFENIVDVRCRPSQGRYRLATLEPLEDSLDEDSDWIWDRHAMNWLC
jgi:hypothetical protein